MGTAPPFYTISLKLGRDKDLPISAQYPYGDRWKILQLGAILTFITGTFKAKIIYGVKTVLIFPSGYVTTAITITVKGEWPRTKD